MDIAALIISSDCPREMMSINLSMTNYEKIIFDSLIASSYDIKNGNANSSNNKHLWIKKVAFCQTDYLVITKNTIMRL
jgi:hypothetical protein